MKAAIATISILSILAAPYAVAAQTGDGGLGKFTVPSLSKDMPMLRGQVSTYKGRSPLIMSSPQEIPEGTKVDLVVPEGIVLNSELSQKGDEVIVRIARDIKDGGRVLLPGNWYIRGLVTESVSQKRGGRNGYVEVQFDKLVSPEGDYELDFNAKFSTKDNKMMSIAKVVTKDAGYVAAGGAAGAFIAFQLSGVPLTVMSQGYNIAGGAAVGGAIGLFAALKRKGKIASIYGGDTLKLVVNEPIKLPGFDPSLLPSAEAPKRLEGLDLVVKDYKFSKPWWNDRSAKILALDLEVANNTEQSFHFFDLVVVNDHDQRYSPLPMGGVKNERVPPGKSGVGKVVFTVGSPKRKYSLIFLSRRTGKELSRVAIN